MDTHSSTPQVLIVEDHDIVRLALKVLLSDLPDPVNVFEAASFTQLMRRLHTQYFDLILLDLNIPDGDGLLMISRIRETQPKVRILVVSSSNEQIYGMHCIKAGANGFLSKLSSEGEIRKAIVAVMKQGHYLSEAMRMKVIDEAAGTLASSQNPLENLSARELTITNLLIEGYWTKEIAIRLSLTESSVSLYKSRLFEKLGVTSLIELFKKVIMLR